MISNFEWLQAGHCLSLDAFTIKGGCWRVDRYPAGFGLFHHPKEGWVLFDTGYSAMFYEASRKLPYRLYRYATPVRFSPEQSARAQLEQRSIKSEDVGTVILSHLHADHICGLGDFPRATIITSRVGYDFLAPLRGMAAVRNGFLPRLMPRDFEQRVRWVEDQPDLFGDGTVRMVSMPGHAPGQYGARVLTDSGEKLLCADACWQSRSYRDLVDLPALIHRFLTHDTAAFRQTLSDLHSFSKEHPEVMIHPSHCSEVFA